jgi:hypothetical protein
MVETTCQPVLEDHSSRRLEHKHHFLLAIFVAKSFTFVFDCSGETILPKHFLINRSHKPDTPTKVTSVASSFDLSTHPHWYLFFAILLIGSPREKSFKIQIICGISFDNFASSFDLSTHPVDNKLFKIQIICGISFDNFVSSFWSLST